MPHGFAHALLRLRCPYSHSNGGSTKASSKPIPQHGTVMIASQPSNRMLKIGAERRRNA
jgi:hypothetical protein